MALLKVALSQTAGSKWVRPDGDAADVGRTKAGMAPVDRPASGRQQ
jgi:hypothetical protein